MSSGFALSCSLVLLVALSAPGARAQESTAGASSAESTGRDYSQATVIRVNPAALPRRPQEEDLSDKWFRFKNYIANGLMDEAAAEFSEIVALQKQSGIPRAVDIADAMVYEGEMYLQTGDLAKARILLSSATVMDKYQGEAYAALAWTALRTDKMALWTFLKNNIVALKCSVKDFWDRFALLANVGIAFGLSLMIAFVIFGIIMMVKYGLLFRHDLQEWRATSNGTLWFALAVSAPLLLWLGVWWVACYWVTVLWVYLSWQERAISAVMLIFAVVLPLAIPVYQVFYAAYRNPAIQALVASRAKSQPMQLIERLDQYSSEHPNDVDIAFVLGNMYYQVGRLDEGLAVFNKVIERDRGYQMAYVNAGNIFYQLRDYENAIKNYLRALDVDPKSALINYNIKVAYSERFDFGKAEQYLRRAKEIDSAATERYLAGTEAKVVTEEFTSRKIWTRMLSGRVSPGTERDPPLWPLLFSRPEVRRSLASIYYPMLALMLVGGVVYGVRRTKDSIALSCVKCGRAFCRKCQRGVGRDRYCSQCAHIFLVKDGISEDARIRKFNEIQKFDAKLARVYWAMALVLPGSERILGERPVRGFLGMTAWLFLICVAFVEAWFFQRIVPFEEYTARFVSALLGAAILLFYGAYNWRNLAHPMRLGPQG
ncbi:MAG: tetratricopeptide repeat protein [Acidobacteriota bacterium]